MIGLSWELQLNMKLFLETVLKKGLKKKLGKEVRDPHACWIDILQPNAMDIKSVKCVASLAQV